MAAGFNREVLTLPSRHLSADIKFALDIGGSLAKVAYVAESKENSAENEIEVHLVTFDTDRLDECLDFLRKQASQFGGVEVSVRATGVGCTKYREKISSALNVSLEPDCDEMLHAAQGLDILWQHLLQEKLVYSQSEVEGLKFQTTLRQSGVAPCILVNVGSAITISAINKDGHMSQYVGGSAQGGLTFLGLGALLTKAKSFQELVELAEKGDHREMDLLVKDTAGSSYHMAPAEGMVSSFGKAARARFNGQNLDFSEEDIASSLLFAITDNVATHAYYVAKCQGVHWACFCGSYLAGNKTALHMIKTKLANASVYLQHKVKPIFLQHEGYLGTIGALLGHYEKQSDIANGPTS